METKKEDEEEKEIEEAAIKINVPVDVIKRRLLAGVPKDEALTLPRWELPKHWSPTPRWAIIEAEQRGLKRATIFARLYDGWDPIDALTLPKGSRSNSPVSKTCPTRRTIKNRMQRTGQFDTHKGRRTYKRIYYKPTKPPKSTS